VSPATGYSLVLREITNRVSSVLTEKSVFGRIGGEEFVIATSDINDEDTLKLAEKIRHVIGDEPIKIDSEELNITVSLGVTNYKHQNTIDELMKECDDLMYKAKDAGRNRFISNIRSLPRK
jgi:diguanylate cyclase (GGDEF)-like protein